jgi:heavy metal sensor kinase
MCFDRINRLRHALAFRLTLWYAALFVFSATVVFVLFYLLITSMIRQRTDDNLLNQYNEFAAVYRLQGIGMLQRAASLQAQTVGEKKMFFRLFYPSGVVFSASNMTYWRDIGIDRWVVESVLSINTHRFVTEKMPGGKYHVRVIYARIGSAVILQMGYSMADEERLLLVFKQLFFITMSGLLVLAMMGGWFMARRALSGVAMVTRAAQQISEQDLTARVPVRHRHNEIDLLAITFNQMLDRVQNLITGIRQMSDNIAHDLRSPITRIRGLAEVTLTGNPSGEDYQLMTASTIEECDRLLDMINTMLTISRTEAGVNPLERLPVDLAVLAKDACELFLPLAEDKSLTIEQQLEHHASVDGDQRMLQRMIANLIDNAIKYNLEGGRVIVSLTPGTDGMVCLTISDTGIGISDEDQSKIFDRFFRGDQSRTQSGAGLGLSLAQAVARAHGGWIQVSSTLQRGSSFCVILPTVSG